VSVNSGILGYPDLGDESFVYTALLEYGMFPEKAPRCFQSIGLEAAPEPYSIQPPPDNKKNHSYVGYQATRNTNVPRSMGIPHPESYKALCVFIRDNWESINKHIGTYSAGESRLHVRRIPGEPDIIDDGYELHIVDADKLHIFEMNFKGSFEEQDSHKEQELNFSMKANFLVKTDISNFFPSIYSHALEWAIHGKEESKDNARNRLNHWGYDLDVVQRSTKDRETSGILIGPHTSNILSEIVLTRVDEWLRREGYFHFYRYVDDYTFYARDHDEAKGFIREFTLALKEYELTPNEKKTEILAMADAIEESWVLDLNQFSFPDSDWLQFGAIESYISRARHLQKEHHNSSLLSYAVAVIKGKAERSEYKIHERTKGLYLQLIYSLSIQYPYLCQFLDDRVLSVFYKDTPKNKKYLKAFIESLIIQSANNNSFDGVAHGLHFAIKYDVDLDLASDTLSLIYKANDCVSHVLLYEYSKVKEMKAEKDLIERKARSFLQSNQREQDRFWLLIYQACSVDEMKTLGQHYLAKLKSDGIEFVSFS